MRSRRTVAVLLAAVMLLGGIPAGAIAEETTSAIIATAETAQSDENETVNVTTGQQLSTVLAVTSEEVQTEVESAAFEFEYERADGAERAEAIAERAETLRERATDIREDYEEATEAYEEGELTKSEYAQRIATLNARASNLVEAYDDLRKRAANVSTLELRAAGLNRTALNAAVNDLDSVRGVGAAALLNRFTGQSQGEVELETENGISISVKSADGERSREFERPGDNSSTLTVSGSDALETARAALSEVNGTWQLIGTSVDADEGIYEFAFRLDANETSGEAEVVVDGSSGEVISLEEELEVRKDEAANEEADEEERGGEEPEDDEAEDEDADEEDDEREYALVVADGEIAPNATVTVQVLADGAPAENVTVTLNEKPVATTDANGTVSVTLPAAGEAELRAGEGELEFELGDEDEDEAEEQEVYRNLQADASLDNGTVTVTLTYNGTGVANATVFANDEQVGTTGEDGTVTFDIANETDELEIELVKGEFEAEFTYEVSDGTLSGSGEAEEPDKDREERGDEAEEDDTDEEDETETPEPDEDDSEETETPDEETETDDEDDEDDSEETETAESDDDS